MLGIAACISDTTTKGKGTVPAPQVAKANTSQSLNNTKSQTANRPTENMTVNMDGKKISPNAAVQRDVRANATPKVNLNEVKKPVQQKAPKRVPDQVPEGSLPSTCDLITADYVAEVLGMVAPRDIFVKDGSGANPYTADSRSCFFKWEHNGEPNAGLLVQIQRNSFPDEFPDWASYYISSKKQQGDKLPDESVTYRYKDFPGLGVDGAYNYDLARYIWRTKSGYIFMIAFNLPASAEPEQLLWAEKLGKVVNKNFEAFLKKKK